MEVETVLVTGAAGFIGPQVVRLLLQETKLRVIVVDKLTYAARVDETTGKPTSLEMVLSSFAKDIDLQSRYCFVKYDICETKPSIKDLLDKYAVDYVIHMAAESHVDRSTEGKPDFIRTEIFGTYNLLEAIRAQNTGRARKVKRAVFVSTDEVYGSIERIAGFDAQAWYGLSDTKAGRLIEKYQFTEATSLAGGSPYASCKGGADLLVCAYFNTFRWNPDNGKIDLDRMPVIITRGVNNFGYFQHPEKLIPMAICTLLHPQDSKEKARRIPIYDKGLAVREWLRTEDYASAIVHVMKYGTIGEVYNVGSGNRCRNRDLLLAIFRACREEHAAFNSLAEASFDATTVGGVARPGHDLCYSVNCDKIHRLGWEPQHGANFEQKLRDVVDWYVKNQDWWKPLWLSEDFTAFWNKKYRKIMELSDRSFDFYQKHHAARKLQEALLDF